VNDPLFFHLSNDALSLDELGQLAKIHTLHFTQPQLTGLARLSGNNLAILEKIFRLAKDQEQILPSLLHRLKSRPLSELSCTSSYQYPNMEIPISGCFQMADPRICSSFAHWTVFETNRWTPLDILSLNWPLDLCGWESDKEIHGMIVQDLRNLVWNSLLDQRESLHQAGTSELSEEETNGHGEADEGEEETYRINPLIHSFMLHNFPDGYTIFKKSYNFLLEKLRDRSSSEKESPYGRYLSSNFERMSKSLQEVELMETKQKETELRSANKGQDERRLQHHHGYSLSDWMSAMLSLITTLFRRIFGRRFDGN